MSSASAEKRKSKLTRHRASALEALRAQIFEKSVARVKRMTARVPAARLQAIVRKAARYARRIR